MKLKILTFFLDYIRRIFAYKYVRYTLVLAFSIFVIILSGPFIANFFASVLFNSNNYSSSKVIWSIGSKISLYDKYVMYYNAGNASFRSDDMQQAINKYEESLSIAPESKICQIKWNTVMAYVNLGDKSEKDDPTKAIGLYSRALFHLSYKACLDKPENNKKWDDLTKELKDKIEKLKKKLDEKKNNSEYKPDPNFQQPTDQERKKNRNIKVQDSKNSSEYEESKKLSSEDKQKAYEDSWW